MTVGGISAIDDQLSRMFSIAGHRDVQASAHFRPLSAEGQRREPRPLLLVQVDDVSQGLRAAIHHADVPPDGHVAVIQSLLGVSAAVTGEVPATLVLPCRAV